MSKSENKERNKQAVKVILLSLLLGLPFSAAAAQNSSQQPQQQSGLKPIGSTDNSLPVSPLNTPAATTKNDTSRTSPPVAAEQPGTPSLPYSYDGKPDPNFPNLVGPLSSDTKMLEEVPLKLPASSELLPVGANLPTIRLEASYNQPVSLKDTVIFAVLNNLAIGISQEQMRSQKWLMIGAIGNFAPDALMMYRSLFQAGSTLVGGVIPTQFSTPNVVATAGFRYWGFRGGQILFTALAAKHNFLAAKSSLKATINDTLLAVASQYYDLVRQQAFLEIRVRAVDTSRAQLVLNKQLEAAGTGTYFNVLQADTQLANDEQNLLSQEVTFRTAAITLARTLNLDLGANLMTVDSRVRKVRLIDPSLDINGLMKVAVKFRPELRQFEELRLAARRNIQVAAAPLYPTMQFFGQYAGNGATLGPGYTVVPGNTNVVAVPGGSYNPSAVNVPGLSGTSVPSVASSQSSIATSGGTITNPGPVLLTQSYTPAYIGKRQMRMSYQIGFEIDWNYFGLGINNVANVQSNRHIARQALLQANQTFLNVMQQVRTSYLQCLIIEKQIDVATRAVASSSEQLRLARVRLANGVGTNIDVLQAQQVWTQSLINKADTILRFNQAQVQLLHDLGVISVDTLTSGRLYKGLVPG
ncbi:MAG: TolC family protein [Candidatus Obscuribacterales bacterium]|nr:TolC family protein [Candidatus Obscuribacterales bacterium]